MMTTDLHTVLDQAARRHLVAGASVCVLDGEGMRHASLGVRQVGSSDPVTAETTFPLGSVTKIFTAIVVCQLVAEGAVGLDEPVVRHIPELAVLGPVNEAITVRMLLCHTSGLADAWEPFNSFADLITATRRTGPVGARGELFSYTNTGYVVLGRLIETLTDQSWEDNLRRRLFDRIGVSSAVFCPPQTLPPSAAHGHVADGRDVLRPGDLWPPVGPLFGPAGSNLHASAADTARLVLACATGRDPAGRALLPEALHRTMLTEQVELPGRPLHFRGWGLGWAIPVHGNDTHKAVQHIGGTSALVHADPDRNLTVAVLTNFPEGWSFGRDVLRAILGVPATLPSIGPVPADPARYIGEYRSPAFGLTVRHDGHRLRISNPLNGPDVDLHHQDGDAFWADFGELLSEVTFLDIEGGRARRMHAALRMLQRVAE
jgi:CubicO group peptidase (beta-lactamase class C family)